VRLLVVSHKICWRSAASPSGFATFGGFPLQMHAITELFDETTLAVPVIRGSQTGEMPISGHNLHVLPLTNPRGRGLSRKLGFPLWLARNLPRLAGALRSADAVHTPIPGDMGTIGMLLASVTRKPLFVRYCGNWTAPARTRAQRFSRWYMERHAGGRNVMFATGGGTQPPSPRNEAIRWIFSTSLSRRQLAQGNARTQPADGGPRIITVGRQEPGKGTDRVIAALPALCRRWPGTSFDVVGDGSLLARCRTLAAELGVTDAVAFHGKVGHARVIELLAKADLFCFPTESEGFPKAVVEALGSGLPVITTPVSVLPQLVGGGGVVLKDTGAASLVAAVERCLDPKRYGEMSRRARDAAHGYSLEQWRDDIGAALQAAWGPLRA